MNSQFISYQITFKLKSNTKVTIGRLGQFTFPEGIYIYTGSARSNIDKRIERHKRKMKKLHWHIDYLLHAASSEIISIEKSAIAECRLNQSVDGSIVAPGFGSSDCTNHCQSHLKLIEPK